jgi:predicted MFS family arabinose efflux permease
MSFFMQGSTAVLGPANEAIAQGLGISPATAAQVGTLPALFAVISGFLIGQLTGKKLKYKTSLILYLVIAMVGGILPMFISTWPVIMFSRACIGLGVGAFYALPPAILPRFYDPAGAAKNLGMGNAFASAGGMAMMLIVGALAGIKWNYSFAVYFIFLIPLICIIAGMPEPPADAPVDASKPKEKLSLPAPVIINCLFACIMTLFMVPVFMSVSYIVTTSQGHTPFVASVISSFFNIGGVLGSVLFGIIYKSLKKFSAPVIILLEALGLFLIRGSDGWGSVIVTGAGMFCVGVGLILTPALLTDNNAYVKPAAITFVTSLLVIGLNLGNFLTGPYLQLVSNPNDPLAALGFSFYGLVILAVIAFVIRLVTKPPAPQAAAV